MNIRFAAKVALLVGLCASTAVAGGPGWVQDFEKAQTQATKEKKDLLIDFTGSDWCGWCIKLNEEVFSKNEFKAAAPKSFVLVEIDFPQDKSKLDPEIIAQNSRLQAKYAVRGFPTILLADAQGVPYAQTGYQEGGPEKYVAHLHDLAGIREARDESMAKAAKAKGVDRAKHLAEALSAMSDDLVAKYYLEQLQQIVELDPEDTLGNNEQFTALIVEAKSQEIRDKYNNMLREAAQTNDMKKMHEIMETAIADPEVPDDLHDAFVGHYINLLIRSDNYDKALAMVDETIKNAPADKRAKPQLQRAMILDRSGKPDEALAEFEKIAAANADDDNILVNAYFGKAQVLVGAERIEDAVEALKVARKHATPQEARVIDRRLSRLEASLKTDSDEKKDEE